MNEEKNSVYKLEGKPKFSVAFPLGMQHVLAMFVGNIAPIIIICNVLGLPPEQKAFMIQAGMLVSGLVTLIQLYPVSRVGAGLPLVMGTSFAFVSTAIGVGKAYGLPGILGASLIGSIAEIGMGFFLKPLRKFFPPIVTGTVLVAIGLKLIPVGINYFAGGVGAKDFGSPKNLLLGFLVLLIIIVLQQYAKGIMKLASLLVAIIIGYIVAIPMGLVDFSNVAAAGWISFPTPLKYGIEFHFDAILKFAAVYLVVGLETLGNISGITMSGLGREATDDEMSGAVVADGVGSAFAALFSVLPNTGYGQNAGIIALTGVVNKYSVATGAGFLILAGFVPKLGAICAAIPNPVLGGAVLMVFGMITISGIRMIMKTGLDQRNASILAIALSLGLGFSQVPSSLEFMPSVLHQFFGDAVVASGILALIFNIIFPKEKNTIKKEEKSEMA
ncbi:uracil-xanthine permease family protein [Helicovermis profundi]|uniref:Nucleobase:cation symporter-2 family protein n=1 Tax=Helicovermis profundi TaxID=3065157 RepID=A0AAU9EBI7_9FIRM|nr:nucleobase:cation symporter-2 family protein [Clostridia bacterium S502]